MLQIVGHSLTVEMVDDQSFTSGSCTLHLHHTVFDIQHHNGLASVLATQQFAVFLSGLPVQDAILHAVRDIFDRTVMPEKHRLMEYGILAVSLFSRPQVQVLHFISNERLFHKHRPAGTLLQRNPWATERPACARGHVDLNTVLAALLLGVAQHFHPFVGQIRDIIPVVPLHSVERCNLQSTDSVLGILLHVPLQILLVNGRTQPPPTGTGLSLWIHRGPLLSRHHEGQSRKNQP